MLARLAATIYLVYLGAHLKSRNQYLLGFNYIWINLNFK